MWAFVFSLSCGVIFGMLVVVLLVCVGLLGVFAVVELVLLVVLSLARF